jgi:N-acyl-D-amino-acid deacylase
MADYGGLYVTHVRYKKGLLPAIREAIEIGRRAGVAVHISHLKFQEPYTHEQIFELLEEARREVNITYDAYPYQAGSTMLNYLMPYEAWQEGPLAALDQLSRPETRARFREGIRAYRLDLDHIRIAWVAGKENAVHQGKTLADFVQASGKEPADALLELLLEERLAVLCVMDEGDDELVSPFLQHDLFMLGTDGIYFPDGQVHPRMFGSVGRILGSCVRDKQLFTLEEAVAKLSAIPAERFKLLDRGVIRENAFADLVIFDPNTISDRATFDEPSQPTVGISHVLTNGTPIVRDGEPIVADDRTNLPGRFLRFDR